MTNQPVTVTVRIKVRSGMEEIFKQAYLSIVPLTLAEEGCLNYTLHQSKADPSVFMLYEQWQSKELLDRHLQMPYIKQLTKKAGDFLVEPLEVNFWEAINPSWQ